MRRGIVQYTAAKTAAWILLVLFAAAAAFSAAGIVFMCEEGIYTKTQELWYRGRAERISDYYAHTFSEYALTDGYAQGEELIKYGATNIIGVSVRGDAAVDFGIVNRDTKDLNIYVCRLGYVRADETGVMFAPVGDGERSDDVKLLTVTVFVDRDLAAMDNYRAAMILGKVMYAFRLAVFPVCFGSVILAVLCFVFLMCAAGHHPGEDAPRAGWGTAIPFDLLSAGAALICFLLLQLAFEAAVYMPGITFMRDILASSVQVVISAVCFVLCIIVAVGWSMSFALRVKLGKWWENTILYSAGCMFAKLFNAMCDGLERAWRFACGILPGVPMVWKTVVIVLTVVSVELAVLVLTRHEFENLMIWWIIEKVLVIPAVIVMAVFMDRLKEGGRALARGELGYQLDTDELLLDFKEHGENLNRIGDGITRAVEARIKSERMKTELITNVSHDIKTPLTSVINYADLICCESVENEKVREYAQVLRRQADRLKRLMEDLVEASKAASGSIEMHLEPCRAGVLLSQAAGEYSERLNEAGLELMLRVPEEDITVLADGRRLWRVVDNLMGNIVKYALEGTRVYITLEEEPGYAAVSFKNTSREMLDLPAEELAERFVQGSSSRSGDGNGLGLSIAKSLVELQGGMMNITVDGDLFKVVLKLPLL